MTIVKCDDQPPYRIFNLLKSEDFEDLPCGGHFEEIDLDDLLKLLNEGTIDKCYIQTAVDILNDSNLTDVQKEQLMDFLEKRI